MKQTILLSDALDLTGITQSPLPSTIQVGKTYSFQVLHTIIPKEEQVKLLPLFNSISYLNRHKTSDILIKIDV
jgi:hypothetical protein